jgi:large subunit ribosomal protein L18
MLEKVAARIRRHKRLRKRVKGSAQRPRLCVHRSLNNISAQIIDDVRGITLCSASSLEKELKSRLTQRGNKEAAAEVGKVLALRAKEKNITQVAFDRGGYQYHGRVKALAEAARAGGLEF